MAANERLDELSTTDASNTPAGSDVVGSSLDNELRSIKANIARSAREESTATASAAATLAVTVLNKIVPVSGSAAGSTTITLPAAATAGAGFRFTAWKTDNTNNVIIDANGAETINGGADYTMATQYEAAQFVTDGTSWVVESTAKRELGTSDLADDSVTNAKLANMAQDTIKGRATAGTGDPEDLTPAQARTLLDVYQQATADGLFVNVSGDTMTGNLDVTGDVISDGADLDGAVTINESGAAVDLRVESNNNDAMLFVDGTNDRVGIGTSSPSQTLQVVGAAEVSNSGDNTFLTVTSDVAAFFRTKDTSGGADEKIWDLINDAGTIQWRYANDADNSNALVYLTNRSGNTVTGQDWYIGSNALAMRIDSTGGLRVGAGSPLLYSAPNEGHTIQNQTTGSGLTVASTDVTGGYAVMNVYSSDAVNATQIAINFVRTTGQVGSIATTASSTAYNTSSDYRLKENVIPLTGAIDRVKTLSPKRFNFTVEPDRTVDGFLAHEVTAVPEAITGTKDQVDDDGNPVYQGIDQSKLVPLLTAALQEAVAKIELLETRISALEAN